MRVPVYSGPNPVKILCSDWWNLTRLVPMSMPDWLKMIEEDKNELMTFKYILYSKVKIDIILSVSFTNS